MRRAFPVVLGLLAGVLVASMTIQVAAQNQAGAEKVNRTSILLDILQLELEQWKGMSGEERRAFIKALPAEKRRELGTAMAASRGTLTPEQRRQGTPVQVQAPPSKSRVTGRIQYDSGNPAGYYATLNFKGNRFNTALTPGITACPGGPGSCPPVLAPGTITQLSAFVLPSPPPAGSGTMMYPARWAVFGAQIGSNVPQLFSDWDGITPSTTLVLTPATPIAYAGPSFQVGLLDRAGWSTTWTTSSTRYAVSYVVPAYDPGTLGSQGHHAVSVASSVARVITDLPGMNMMVRASGNILVPVELMSFSIN